MYDTCNVCYINDDFYSLKKITFNHSIYYFGICKRCSHVMQYNLFDDSHYKSLPCSFPENYVEHSIHRSSYIYDFCKDNLKQKDELSILDLGCGPGMVVKKLSEFFKNCNYKGVSLEDNHSDNNIVQSTIENYTDDKKYDFIILCHVLEHIKYTSIVFKKIKSLLKDDGILYIEVPSYMWGEVRTKNIFTPEHISYFHEISLKNLLSLNGFKIIKYKESRYWGNIKCIVKYTGISKFYKNINYNQLLIKKRFINLMYPYYRFLKMIKKIDAND